jgi:tetratricopeptide (TPR) repeat protein
MTDEEDAARDRLLFHLENQTGFWFALVVSDDTRPRGRLCDAAEAWCRENGRAFTLHEPEPDGLVKLAVELAKGGSAGVHWIRADGVKGVIETWNAAAAQMLMAMNERREAYRRRLEGGIVVEGRLALKRILREMAPDLFSIRAFIAEPGNEPKARASDFPEWRRPISLTSLMSGTQADPELALGQLERLIALEGPATTEKWIEAEGRAMTTLFNAGRFDEAERHARELISRLEQNGNDAFEGHLHRGAWAYKVLAQIALKNGNAKDAIDLLDRALQDLAMYPVNNPGTQFYCGLEAFNINKQRARLLLATGNIKAAKEALERHVGLFSPAAELPPEMQLDLLDSHVVLANILKDQRNFGSAEDILQKAIATVEKYILQSPDDDRWKLEHLRCRTALGRIHLSQGNDIEHIAAALKTLIIAATFAEQLETYGVNDGLWKGVLEEFYFSLSFVLSCQLNYIKSVDRMRERALSSVRQQVERAPDNVPLGWLLAGFYLHRAELLEKEDVTGAKDAAQQALELAARLPLQTEDNAVLKSKIEALRSFVRKPPKKRRPTKR